MDTQIIHLDPCSCAGNSCARYAGVARTRDGAERLCRGIDSCDRAREIAVRVDGAGSGGVVEPGAACWVGISGASGVMGREAQRMNCQ